MLVMSSTPIAVGVVNQGYHSDDVTIDMETANQETTDEVWKDVTCSFSISKQITDIDNCSNLLSLEVNIHKLLKNERCQLFHFLTKTVYEFCLSSYLNSVFKQSSEMEAVNKFYTWSNIFAMLELPESTTWPFIT